MRVLLMAYVIWSNRRRAWWRPNGRGYTDSLDEAGRYDRATAEQIVADATCNGQLTHRRTNPVTGEEYSQVDEVLLLAPEDTPPKPAPGASPKDVYA